MGFNRRMTSINSISEIPCPCRRENATFIESESKYGCPICNLWIRHTVGSYKLSAQDVHDMIYGDRVSPVKNDKGEEVSLNGKPLLARWTDFHEFKSKAGNKFQASIAFEPGSNWKIIWRFPDRAPVEHTGRLCPECQKEGREGQLVIRSTKKGDKFIACNAWPKCKYTEPYAPFMVRPAEQSAVPTAPAPATIPVAGLDTV